MRLRIYKGRFPAEVEPDVFAHFVEIFSAPPRNEYWSVESAAEHIGSHYGSGSTFATVEEGGEIFGFCYGQSVSMSPLRSDIVEHSGVTKGFYLSGVGISPGYTRKGHGRQMVEAFLGAIQQDYKICVSRARADATGMRRVFDALGFEETGDYVAEVRGAVSQRFFYVKELGP